MLYTLSILNPTSLPVSQLPSVDQLDVHVQNETVTIKNPILLEQHRAQTGDVLDGVILEPGALADPIVLYDELNHETVENLCSMYYFAIERKKEILSKAPILLEQHREQAKDILDGVLLELGVSNVPEVVYNEMLVGISEYIHSNFKLRYDVLSSRLLDDISAALGFNTMAYRDAWQHSKITHTHPDEYSYLRCKAMYTKEQVVAMGAEDKDDFREMSNWLGTVVIWQQIGKKYLPISTDIFMPNFVFEDFPEPDIGEVRFVGWKSFPTRSSSPYKEEIIGGTEMISDDQNGGYWVYPHGQTINCNSNEFKDACKVYAGNEKATQFTVPDLREFIRLNPRKELQDPLKKVPWQNNSLFAHTHEIPENAFQTGTQTFTGEIDFPLAFCGDGSGHFHGSIDGTNKEGKLELAGSVDLTEGYDADEQDTTTERIDVETKPFHNSIPLLVYIGRR